MKLQTSPGCASVPVATQYPQYNRADEKLLLNDRDSEMSDHFQLEVSNISVMDHSAPVIGTSLLEEPDKQISTQYTSPKKNVSWMDGTQQASAHPKATPVLGA